MREISEPKNWPLEKLMAWAVANGYPLSPESTNDERNELRARLQHEHEEFQALETEKKKAAAQEMFEDGETIGAITKKLDISTNLFNKWRGAAMPPWVRREPGESKPDAVDADSLAPLDLLHEDEAASLSTEVQDIRAEARLMQLDNAQWMKVSLPMKKRAFELQLLKHAMHLLTKLNKLPEDEKIDPTNVKTFMALLSAKEKLCPDPVTPQQTQRPGQLSVFVMNGGDGLPPRAKKATAREISVDQDDTKRLDAANAT